jgi:hypothetical protein
MITLEAMSVAELLTADPLTRGRAVACQLLTKQRRLPDDVDGAGLRCRRRSLRLRQAQSFVMIGLWLGLVFQRRPLACYRVGLVRRVCSAPSNQHLGVEQRSMRSILCWT